MVVVGLEIESARVGEQAREPVYDLERVDLLNTDVEGRSSVNLGRDGAPSFRHRRERGEATMAYAGPSLVSLSIPC